MDATSPPPSLLTCTLPNDSVLQATARAGCRTDSIGAIAGNARSPGNGDGKAGKISQVNTADISEPENDEPENDEPSDAADDVVPREELVGGALASVKANDEVPSTSHAPVEAVAVTGKEDAEPDLTRDVVAVNGAHETDRCQHATMRVTLPLSTAAEEYPADLFDVLEAWVFDYLREKLHADFLLSSHFQEYTRFLHVQHRPVTENDFILFRVLGRGGFGAVNGTTRRALHVVLSLSSDPEEFWQP